MVKTAVVLVESKKTHPLYMKSFKRTKKFLVDDPMGVADGDVVIFEKIRPISKNKHWQIKKVLGRDIVSLEQAGLAEEAAEAIAEVLPEEPERSEKSEKSEDLKTGKPEKAEAEIKVEKPKKRTTKKEAKQSFSANKK